jgi:hypothetical protein
VAFGIDRRGVPARLAGVVGDDVRWKVGLLDMDTGAVTGVGATIVATVGGLSATVDYSTQGLFVCSLTDSQTTTLGAGSHTWIFRLTPAGGDTQTYVAGTMTLQDASSTNAGGSYGWQGGIVGNVAVTVA